MQSEKQARAEAALEANKVPVYAYAASARELGVAPEALEAIAQVSAEAAQFDPQLNRPDHRSDDPNATLELPGPHAGEEDCDPNTPESRKQDPTYLPAVQYFQPGRKFLIGDLEVSPLHHSARCRRPLRLRLRVSVRRPAHGHCD